MNARTSLPLFFSPALLLGSLAFGACTTSTDESDDGAVTGTSESALIAGREGAVYTSSNDAAGNQILVFRRAADGTLQRAATYDTTGLGSGDGLGSQGAVVLAEDRRSLFAVNAGSNEISVFEVRGESLFLIDVVPSGGVRPVSVAVKDQLVYVVNAGNAETPANISGFFRRRSGTLVALAGSSRPLSAPAVGPAEIAFSAGGTTLIVTEKMTNLIDEYRLDARTALPGAVQSHPSSGKTPFGFAVTSHNDVIVSEAFGGAVDQGAASSYRIDRGHGVASVSASVASTESAPCWVALSRDERTAFVANTGSGTISRYAVAPDGSISLLDLGGRGASTGDGSKPADLALSRDGSYLYVLNGGAHTVGALGVGRDGTLRNIATPAQLPPFAAGLAAQ